MTTPNISIVINGDANITINATGEISHSGSPTPTLRAMGVHSAEQRQKAAAQNNTPQVGVPAVAKPAEHVGPPVPSWMPPIGAKCRIMTHKNPNLVDREMKVTRVVGTSLTLDSNVEFKLSTKASFDKYLKVVSLPRSRPAAKRTTSPARPTPKFEVGSKVLRWRGRYPTSHVAKQNRGMYIITERRYIKGRWYYKGNGHCKGRFDTLGAATGPGLVEESLLSVAEAAAVGTRWKNSEGYEVHILSNGSYEIFDPNNHLLDPASVPQHNVVKNQNTTWREIVS